MNKRIYIIKAASLMLGMIYAPDEDLAQDPQVRVVEAPALDPQNRNLILETFAQSLDPNTQVPEELGDLGISVVTRNRSRISFRLVRKNGDVSHGQNKDFLIIDLVWGGDSKYFRPQEPTVGGCFDIKYLMGILENPNVIRVLVKPIQEIDAQHILARIDQGPFLHSLLPVITELKRSHAEQLGPEPINANEVGKGN